MTIKLAKVKGTYFEMGEQLGRQLADILRHPMLPYANAFLKGSNTPPREKRVFIKRYEDEIEKRAPYLIEEFKGIAKGAKLRYEDLLFVLLIYEFTGFLSSETSRKISMELAAEYSSQSCTAFVAAGEATADDKPVAAQNMDMGRMMTEGVVVVSVEPKDGNNFLAASVGAMNAMSGFNEKGLGFVGSGVGQKDADFGFPVMKFVRIALEKCGSVDEVIDLVKGIPRWGHSALNIDVVDGKGYMARIAFSSKRVIITSTQNYFIASASHYLDLEMQHLGPSACDYESSYERYDRIVELLRCHHGKIDTETTMAILSDHKFGMVEPETWKSLCRHGKLGTVASVIERPSERKLWISKGPPCKREFRTFAL